MSRAQFFLRSFLATVGLATPDRRTFRSEVTGGCLNIEFVPGERDPSIAAIEVRAVK